MTVARLTSHLDDVNHPDWGEASRVYANVAIDSLFQLIWQEIRNDISASLMMRKGWVCGFNTYKLTSIAFYVTG